MTNNPSSSARDAVDVLRQVDALQRRTNDLLRAFWFPLVVFGALTLLSAPVQWVSTGVAIGVYWAFAGPLGGLAIAWYYRSRELRLGLTQSATPYVLTAIGILVGTFVLPALTSGDLQEVVSVFAVAAGYLVFAWLDRSPLLAALAVGMAGVAVVVLASGVDHPGAITAAVSGAATLTTGLVVGRRERTRP